MRKLIFSLFIIFSLASKAQEIKPKGVFLADSMLLAEPVLYSFSVSYPSNIKLVFPDSSYNYFPFEYRSKKYFTTKSDSISSTDSVVYELASFEIDQLQSLSLPVFVLRGNDSVPLFSEKDTIVFQETIQQPIDTLQAKESTNYLLVERDFNYPYLAIGAIILCILAIVILVLFGKRISNKWKIYRLNKKQDKFVILYKSKIESKAGAQELFKEWTKHCESLSRLPLRKLTVKEIALIFNDEALNKHLNAVNRKIYSSSFQQDISEDLLYLLDYSQVILENRIKQIQND